MANAVRAMQLLQGMGYPMHVAAGIVGNLQQESGRGLNPLLVHDGGTGFGIAGWRDPTPGRGRRTNLYNFATRGGGDARDLDTQIRFLDHELRTDYSGIRQRLLAARDAGSAAHVFIDYEKPQGWSAKNPSGGHGYSARVANAWKLAGQRVPAGPVAPAAPAPAGGPGFTAPAGLQGMAAARMADRQSVEGYSADPPAADPSMALALAQAQASPLAQSFSSISDNLRRRREDDARAERERKLALFGPQSPMAQLFA